MLFFRLILLSWFISDNVVGGQLAQKENLNSPLPQDQQSLVNTQQSTSSPEMTDNFNQPISAHHPARPSNVKGHSKDLMSQVIASTIKHRGDHPRKYVDYFDNGASWDHYMSKPKGHQSEMRIDDSNYHVHLKYGNHDELEQSDKLIGNHNMETYTGETISGENSLSKFMAPPVYDGDADSFQRTKLQTEDKYVPDTPEAAATEKLNTEQLVNRLNSLMTPLSPPFDTDGEKKSIKGSQSKQLGTIMGIKRPTYEESYNRHGQGFAREKTSSFGLRGNGGQASSRRNGERAVRRENGNHGARRENGDQVVRRENGRMQDKGDYRNVRERNFNSYNGDNEYRYYHKGYPGGYPGRKRDREGEENNSDGPYRRNNENRRYRKKYENVEMFHGRPFHSREDSAHAYNHDNEREREEEHEETSDVDADYTAQDLEAVDERGESKYTNDYKSLINLNTRPENEFDTKFNEEGL